MVTRSHLVNKEVVLTETIFWLSQSSVIKALTSYFHYISFMTTEEYLCHNSKSHLSSFNSSSKTEICNVM